VPVTTITVLLLLAVVVGLEILAQRLDVPRPIALLAGGIGIALIPGLPRAQLDPDVIFLIFIPPLLYWTAINSSLRDFRAYAVAISMSGVVLVLASIAAVATVVHALLPTMSWAVAVILGAIVAPPDVVVMASMLRGMVLPRTVATILLGESLVNDAASLVVYRMAVTAAVVGAFAWKGALLDFAWIALGGLGIGLAVGILVAAIRGRAGDSATIQNGISLLTPFAAYLPADAAHVSGVLSVVAAGLCLGRLAPRIMTAQARVQARETWEVVSHYLESLTFLLIGLDLPFAREALHNYRPLELIGYVIVVSVVLSAVRFLMVLPTAYFQRWASRELATKLNLRYLFFLGWAGLRGGDSLVIALTLPQALSEPGLSPGRNFVIVLTFGVVLVSVFIQGPSLRPVAQLLGLRDDGLARAEERDARHQVALAGLCALEGINPASFDWVDGLVVSEVMQELREMHATAPVSSSLETKGLTPPNNRAWIHAYYEMRSRMVRAERAEAIRLRDAEVINEEVMYRILREMDLEEVLLTDRLRFIAEPADLTAGLDTTAPETTA
jgi:Na+/H+ antiporter